MTTENELINKTYYQHIINGNEEKHPITIMGDMYMEEMKKQRPNLSSIRYAQGEVYFLNKDYEAAIYKWSNHLDEQFIPWAQKNIADAHLELGLLEEAEKCYIEVETQSTALKVEVLLQLFSLYIKQDRYKDAVNEIKSAVNLEPDYSNVTEIARSFFENFKDWDNAIELAVNEAIRTKSLSWFEILEGYVEQGLTMKHDPNYFHEVLETLLDIDKYRFERFTEVLWHSYEQSDFYVQWIEEINQILSNNHVEDSYMWKKLSNLFKQSYFHLISGNFLIKEISQLIQIHLTNWLKISSASDALLSSTAILAWDEIFPSSLDATLVSEAVYQFEHLDTNQNDRQEGIKLLESIKGWAKEEGLVDDLFEFIQPMHEVYNIEVASAPKIQRIIKASIEFLMEKRLEVEHGILEKMNWNEELLVSVNDINRQLGNEEKDRATVMKDSFSTLKTEFIQNIHRKLPKVLQNCAEIIHEESDFKKIHVEINDEMNRQLTNYMQTIALQNFKHAINKWIDDCESEFKDIQTNIEEMSESFNYQYGEEKIVMHGDFKVLDDWRRDLERIARGMVHLEKANIMLRNNPSQLLLKGAGKLLGSISKNKETLHSRYKSYIENVDYSPVVKDIINPFVQQLELFEGSIEWDVNTFFAPPFEVLSSVSGEIQGEIDKHRSSLEKMREVPEIYRDPLTLFELRLRQYELMNTIK